MYCVAKTLFHMNVLASGRDMKFTFVGGDVFYIMWTAALGFGISAAATLAHIYFFRHQAAIAKNITEISRLLVKAVREGGSRTHPPQVGD
jgi:hypothetical protein